jgi:hypothetical protein
MYLSTLELHYLFSKERSYTKVVEITLHGLFDQLLFVPIFLDDIAHVPRPSGPSLSSPPPVPLLYSSRSHPRLTQRAKDGGFGGSDVRAGLAKEREIKKKASAAYRTIMLVLGLGDKWVRLRAHLKRL